MLVFLYASVLVCSISCTSMYTPVTVCVGGKFAECTLSTSKMILVHGPWSSIWPNDTKFIGVSVCSRASLMEPLLPVYSMFVVLPIPCNFTLHFRLLATRLKTLLVQPESSAVLISFPGNTVQFELSAEEIVSSCWWSRNSCVQVFCFSFAICFSPKKFRLEIFSFVLGSVFLPGTAVVVVSGITITVVCGGGVVLVGCVGVKSEVAVDKEVNKLFLRHEVSLSAILTRTLLIFLFCVSLFFIILVPTQSSSFFSSPTVLGSRGALFVSAPLATRAFH